MFNSNDPFNLIDVNNLSITIECLSKLNSLLKGPGCLKRREIFLKDKKFRQLRKVLGGSLFETINLRMYNNEGIFN